MDQEIMSLFRKLQKKDAITKVKALKSLQNYVEKVGPSYTDNDEYAEQGSELAQALTFFLYHFERIITYEVEKSVREAAHDVLGAFLNRGLDNVEYGITISQNFLYFIQEKVSHFDMLLSEDMTNLEKPQRESIYDRIISGCIDSLSDSFETFACCKENQSKKSWNDENTNEYISQIVDVFTLNSNESLPVVFKFLAAKYSPPIRSASLRLLEKMSSYMISFDALNKSLFEKHIHKLANLLFSSLADQSSQVQKVLWRSVIYSIITQFQEQIWQQVDLKKGVLPHLHACLKNAGFGAHSELYKNFVAFVSLVPLFNFEGPFETHCKLEQPKTKSKQNVEEEKETKEENDDEDTKKEDEKEEQNKKGKKKAKKNKEKQADVPQDKFIKNSFSISEKVNVMYDLMKSLFSGIENEEAIAFDEEIVSSYYDTICYLYIKKILPSIEALVNKKEDKNIQIITQKATQCFMYPVSEFLKKNDPKLNKSLYSSIPEKFTKALVLLADKGIEVSKLDSLFNDIKEILMIGIERSPQSTIKLLSVIMKNIPKENAYFTKIQEIGRYVIHTLYSILIEGVKSLSKDTIEKFEKDVEVFSYISYSILTMNLNSDIFEISDQERVNGKVEPHEFSILVNILKMVKIVGSKLKPEVLQSLELIEEKFWLCLILRVNYLCKRNSTEIIEFMESQMLDLIFENIKEYGIDTDRYLRFVIQYISPSDCLSLLISENIERKPDPRKFKKKILEERNKEIEELFAPYENSIRSSSKIQDNCMKVQKYEKNN